MIALSTGTLHSWGLERVFRLAADVGYDGIEVIVDHRLDTRDVDYLRRLSERYGLPILALHAPFAASVPGWPDDQLGRLERTVSLAQELSVPVVVTHLPFRVYGVRVAWFGPRARSAFLPVFWPRRGPYYDLLREGGLARMEETSGVAICVENMPSRRMLGVSLPLYWFNCAEELIAFPHLTLDTTHVGTWGDDLLAFYGQIAPRVAHVHLSNYDGREHRAPPDGRLPLDALLHRLAGNGYAGVVSVEGGPDAFDAHDEARCRAALARTLAFCREHWAAGA